MSEIKQRGSVMWALIISLIYHRSCRKHLSDMRRSRWDIAAAG
jgi:hypothetical protein